MNPRIRQLAEQAGWTNAYTNPKDGFEPVFEGEDHNLDCIEKFAELIVRECAQVIQAQNDIENYLDSWDHGFVAGLATAIDAIEQHFEVKS
jgi:hypothetical protein